MRISVVLGYAFTSSLYLLAWWNPAIGSGKALVDWVDFGKLCLAEFLTVHATTLLGAVAFAMESDAGDENWKMIFWVGVGFYFVLGSAAYLFHGSSQALLSFYLLLAMRGSQFASLRIPETDIMRSVVVKNFAMFVPMMFLVGAISMSDDLITPWQTTFMQNHSTFLQRVWRGKPLLFVAAYYLLWAVVEWKWPLRMSGK